MFNQDRTPGRVINSFSADYSLVGSAFGDDTFFVSQAFAQWEEEFFSVTHMLQQVLPALSLPMHAHSRDRVQAGVPVQTLQTEYGKGQVEIVLDPTFGIEGAGP